MDSFMYWTGEGVSKGSRPLDSSSTIPGHEVSTRRRDDRKNDAMKTLKHVYHFAKNAWKGRAGCLGRAWIGPGKDLTYALILSNRSSGHDPSTYIKINSRRNAQRERRLRTHRRLRRRSDLRPHTTWVKDYNSRDIGRLGSSFEITKVLPSPTLQHVTSRKCRSLIWRKLTKEPAFDITSSRY